ILLPLPGRVGEAHAGRTRRPGPDIEHTAFDGGYYGSPIRGWTEMHGAEGGWDPRFEHAGPGGGPALEQAVLDDQRPTHVVLDVECPPGTRPERGQLQLDRRLATAHREK